ncbi:gamma-glutamyl-gamma-aminobutyrate hydrolase family protein [Helicobacter bilis]|uniref:gamma-glutamyl-gamma-aminobutyrate hydrolase family protein n=1 Tax=Helicobacter bilis TaxID=37372 RepID=UPI00248EC3B7|nr:gamma-glutamyl-gamma-aminobutyrate hydrolase family protein [Helicobacter bilis]
MKKRYIAISQRLYSMKEYNEIRESLAIDWGQFFAIHLHDFLMLPLSYKQDIAPYLPDIAGVILSGGNDLSVCNETPLNKERDIFETNLIDLCIKDSIPLLGVCRGAQMIAYYFNSQITPCKNHVGLHEVTQNLESTIKVGGLQVLENKTKNLDFVNYALNPAAHPDLRENLETTQRFITNSFHNYAITELGDGLIALAISSDTKDYSIESFKHKSHNIFGIMWHIERERGMENSEVFQKWKNTLYANSNNKDIK